MSKVKLLWKKTFETIKTQGFKAFLKKVRNYIIKSKNIRSENRFKANLCGDVLFVNGCFLPHPARYRVTHQKEQLFANGITSGEVFYEDLSLKLVKQFRVFVFFRCPYTDMVGEFIALAHKHNKKVFFDIDDLVIDTKYTDKIKFLQNMSVQEKENYDSGVKRMQKTLLLCDGAITTTTRLANELRNYVPEVFINRNVVSCKMMELSEKEIYKRDILPYIKKNKLLNKKEQKMQKAEQQKNQIRQRKIRMGYFSGSITHNEDFELILPVLVKLMEEFQTVELHVIGELDLPPMLEKYGHRVFSSPFVDWEKLPNLIASVDINLAPLTKGIFNEAKSENKWVEAALVKVVTVASKVGAFEEQIEHEHTGLLCDTLEEWYNNLKILVINKEMRKDIAENAYKTVVENYITINSGFPITKYLKKSMTPNIAFVLPSTQISGGILVALTHCIMLQDKGYDVLILNQGIEDKDIYFDNHVINVICLNDVHFHQSLDKSVATLWATLNFTLLYPNIKKRFYLVQGFETNFYGWSSVFKFSANQTYNSFEHVNYVTISKWCKSWLEEKYEKKCRYAPNGIDIHKFYPKKRLFDGKIRILIEGNCDDLHKNVDESFKIVEKLDEEKYEIWYMSYQGKPKTWYRVDKFLYKIPYEKVPEVYQNCHILIKSSILESFSYPPIEMMATGGYVVVSPNDGNIEYLKDGENCFMYKLGDLEAALEGVKKITNDSSFRKKLFDGGIKTAMSRSWQNLQQDIFSLYE